MERMTVAVKVTDSWMVKVLAKQIHTMKWNGRAPGVIVQNRRVGLNETMNKLSKSLADGFHRTLNGEERRVL